MMTEPDNIRYTNTRIHYPDLDTLTHQRIVTGFKPGPWLESFKMLRMRALQLMEKHQWTTLAVTSPHSCSGTSLISTNLAITIAMELDYTVLLVDANLNNASIDTLLDLKTGVGLSDFLLHDKPIQELLINPAIERMVVLPAGTQTLLNSTELLRSPKMVRLVNEFKHRYPNRIIIFDMPPLLAQTDALSFSPYVDCVLLVIEKGKTSQEDLCQSAALLKNTNLLGTVFNKVTENKIKYTPYSNRFDY